VVSPSWWTCCKWLALDVSSNTTKSRYVVKGGFFIKGASGQAWYVEIVLGGWVCDMGGWPSLSIRGVRCDALTGCL